MSFNSFFQQIKNLSLTQKIAVVGLGQENLQFLAWLLEKMELNGEQIIVADQKPVDLAREVVKFLGEKNDGKSVEENTNWLQIKAKIEKKIANIETHFGPDYLQILKDEKIEYVFKAPGIWSLKPEFVDFKAKKGQSRVLSGLVFFLEKYREQIIGVTGTKGKSTTSSLIHHLFNFLAPDFGLKACHYCGNTTGISPYQFWSHEEVNPKQFFVVELSSFQLQDLSFSRLSPKRGVITNYYVDHLDQHSNEQEYWAAKDALFTHQNSEDFLFYTQSVWEKTGQKSLLKKENLVTSEKASQLSKLLNSPLLGAHNQVNLGLAYSLLLSIFQGKSGFELSVFQSKITEALVTFQNLPHRLQLIREVEISKQVSEPNLQQNLETKTWQKVSFYDDGAATEPDAVMAAIKALTEEKEAFLWLWISGKDKGADLQELATLIREKIEMGKIFQLNLCGEVGQNLAKILYNLQENYPKNSPQNQNSSNSHLTQNSHLAQKIELASQNKQNFQASLNGSEMQSLKQISIDFQAFLEKNHPNLLLPAKNSQKNSSKLVKLNVVLSPCGSSFDEFTNYLERSHFWQEKVLGLK